MLICCAETLAEKLSSRLRTPSRRLSKRSASSPVIVNACRAHGVESCCKALSIASFRWIRPCQSGQGSCTTCITLPCGSSRAAFRCAPPKSQPMVGSLGMTGCELRCERTASPTGPAGVEQGEHQRCRVAAKRLAQTRIRGRQTRIDLDHDGTAGRFDQIDAHVTPQPGYGASNLSGQPRVAVTVCLHRVDLDANKAQFAAYNADLLFVAAQQLRRFAVAKQREAQRSTAQVMRQNVVGGGFFVPPGDGVCRAKLMRVLTPCPVVRLDHHVANVGGQLGRMATSRDHRHASLCENLSSRCLAGGDIQRLRQATQQNAAAVENLDAQSL